MALDLFREIQRNFEFTELEISEEYEFSSKDLRPACSDSNSSSRVARLVSQVTEKTFHRFSSYNMLDIEY